MKRIIIPIIFTVILSLLLLFVFNKRFHDKTVLTGSIMAKSNEAIKFQEIKRISDEEYEIYFSFCGKTDAALIEAIQTYKSIIDTSKNKDLIYHNKRLSLLVVEAHDSGSDKIMLRNYYDNEETLDSVEYVSLRGIFHDITMLQDLSMELQYLSAAYLTDPHEPSIAFPDFLQMTNLKYLTISNTELSTTDMDNLLDNILEKKTASPEMKIFINGQQY